MKIAVTADPELPVPPKLYGGIERVIEVLVNGFTARGHEVTLFAHPESVSPGKLLAWPGRSSVSLTDTARNAAWLARHVAASHFDLVHSFSRIAYMLPILAMPIPKLMTYQRRVTRRSVALGHGLSRGTLQFSAISRAMMKGVDDVGTWHMVFNGVPIARYTLRQSLLDDAPLVFLGRVEEIKGPHLAIEVARRIGKRLLIAGNIPDEHRSWFAANVAPHIDGDRVKYIGPVDDRQKDELLGSARALLMPILWEEPFGIVMAEAMACGTPVIGFRRGSVPEVVAHGVSGFVVDDIGEMASAIGRIGDLDRRAVRDWASQNFSEDAIVDSYLKIYAHMIARRGSPYAASVSSPTH